MSKMYENLYLGDSMIMNICASMSRNLSICMIKTIKREYNCMNEYKYEFILMSVSMN